MKTVKKLLILGFIAIVAFGGFMAFGNSRTTAAEKKAVTEPEAGPAKDTKGAAAEVQRKQEGAKVVVYYFHGNVRCPSCIKLEEYSGEAINNGFQKELSAGSVEFRSINVDEEANKHFIQEYQLVSRSVVVSKIENGKEVKWKNLDMIWHLVGNHDKYAEYIKNETKNIIEGKS